MQFEEMKRLCDVKYFVTLSSRGYLKRTQSKSKCTHKVENRNSGSQDFQSIYIHIHV